MFPHMHAVPSEVDLIINSVRKYHSHSRYFHPEHLTQALSPDCRQLQVRAPTAPITAASKCFLVRLQQVEFQCAGQSGQAVLAGGY